MNNAKATNNSNHGEPDSTTPLSKLMNTPPTTREQHSQRLSKRGDVRRRVEDLLLAKESQDLW